MSEHSGNDGNQLMTFGFQQEARSRLFNQAFCDVIPYGLYSGGDLYRISSNLVQVSPLVCVIKSNENDNIALRIETKEPHSCTVIESRPFIVLRFGWHDKLNNFMNICNTSMDDLEDYDIILGRAIFVNINGNPCIAEDVDEPDRANSPVSFDLSRRQFAYSKELEKLYNQFRVSSTEPSSNGVYINSGFAQTSKGWKAIIGTNLTIPETENNLHRIDLVVINSSFEIKIIQGTPATEDNVKPPLYQNYIVLAEVLRRPNSVITGGDIKNVTHNMIKGAVDSKDFPLHLDSTLLENINYKNTPKLLDDIISLALIHLPALNPYADANLKTILKRHINFSTSEPDGISAESIPVKDVDLIYNSFNKNIESILKELKILIDDTKEILFTKQDKLNRTIGSNDNATGTVTDQGGNLSIPIQTTTTSPSASSTQTTAGTRNLREQLKILIDNIAHLFANKADTTHSHSILTRGTGLTGSNYDGSTERTFAVDFGTGENQVSRGNHTHEGLGSTGHSIQGLNVRNQTINLNTYFTWNGESLEIIYCPNDETASISNKPDNNANRSFYLELRRHRQVSATDFRMSQTFYSNGQIWQRFCNNGTWAVWLNVSNTQTEVTTATAQAGTDSVIRGWTARRVREAVRPFFPVGTILNLEGDNWIPTLESVYGGKWLRSVEQKLDDQYEERIANANGQLALDITTFPSLPNGAVVTVTITKWETIGHCPFVSLVSSRRGELFPPVQLSSNLCSQRILNSVTISNETLSISFNPSHNRNSFNVDWSYPTFHRSVRWALGWRYLRVS